MCAGTAWPPAALISVATLSASSERISATRTFAPNSAKCLAIPSPNPPPDPVTIAVRPLSFMVPFVCALDATHTEVLDFDKLLDTVLRAFAPDAGLLDAAKGGHLAGDEPLIDSDDAIFQSLGHAPDAPGVARVEVGGQAELGVVAHRDDFLLGGEAGQRSDGAERLLVHQPGPGWHIEKDGGLEESPSESVAFATHRNFGSMSNSVGDVVFDLVHGCLVDEGPDAGAGAFSVAHDQRSDCLLQLGGERIVDAVFHEDAIGTYAGLPAVAELGDHDAGNSAVEIGIGEDNERRIAAEFERHLLDRAGALLEQ